MGAAKHRHKTKQRWGIAFVAVITLVSSNCRRARAQTESSTQTKTTRTLALHLDTEKSKIDWTVGLLAGKAHGTFKLNGGAVIVDPKTGVAQGEIEIDSASGTLGDGKSSDSQKRTGKWQKGVLDSARYPAIIFHPVSVEGMKEGDGEQNVRAKGTLTLAATDHPVELAIHLSVSGKDVTATTHFEVPYVKWGLRNPSAGFNRYKNEVSVDIVAKGSLERQTAQPSASPSPGSK